MHRKKIIVILFIIFITISSFSFSEEELEDDTNFELDEIQESFESISTHLNQTLKTSEGLLDLITGVVIKEDKVLGYYSPDGNLMANRPNGTSQSLFYDDAGNLINTNTNVVTIHESKVDMPYIMYKESKKEMEKTLYNEEFQATYKRFWADLTDKMTLVYYFMYLITFGILVYQLTYLQFIPDHPTQKRKAQVDMVKSITVAFLMGYSGLLVHLFANTLNKFIGSGVVYVKNWKVAAVLFLGEMRFYLTLFYALCIIVSVGGLIYSIARLAKVGEEGGRYAKSAWGGITLSLTSILGLGAVGYVVSLIFSGM